MNYITEGGPLFMIPLIILLLLTILLIIKGVKNNTEKNRELIKGISLFAFVFGVFGFVLGLISALAMISVANEVSMQVLATGFNAEMIPPTFGLIIFLVGKAGIIALTWIKKN